MSGFKVSVLWACLFAFALALPTESIDAIRGAPAVGEFEPVLVRRVRSPDGHIDLTYKDDRAGREASVQYNQKLYRSGDGRVNVDAYAHGTRNFDANRNDYGGGVRGSIRF